MRSHIVALMKGAKEEALRTSLGGIISFLTGYPDARDQFSELLCNASATTFSNGLLEFVITAQRKAFERAIGKGTCLLEGGYAEWEELDEKGNVSFRPQCLDPLARGTEILAPTPKKQQFQSKLSFK